MERLRRLVVGRDIRHSSARETGLDERRTDAGVVGEGSDVRRVDREPVSLRQERLAGRRVVN